MTTNEPANGQPTDQEVGDRILELLARIPDHQRGVEVVGEIVASYIQRVSPTTTLRRALSDTLLAVVSTYMPASKYNGLFFDEVDLGDIEAELSVMADPETFPALNDGTLIGEYPFEYESSYPNAADRASSMAGNHGTGMTILEVANCILAGKSKHGTEIHPNPEMAEWAAAVVARRSGK